MPKLQRVAEQAITAGASVAVFGHWHIPLLREVDGVTIINPGAVASGNAISRQIRQTVALLEVTGEGTVSVQHVDLAHPDKAYDPAVNWDAGFAAALARYSDSILAPELRSRLLAFLGQISDEDQAMLLPLVLKLAHRCWDGEFEYIDSALLRTELANEPSLSAQDKDRFARLLG